MHACFAPQLLRLAREGAPPMRDVHRSAYATLRGTLSVPKCCQSGQIAISAPGLKNRPAKKEPVSLLRGKKKHTREDAGPDVGSFVKAKSS